jgi:serine/threonine protein kinase
MAEPVSSPFLQEKEYRQLIDKLQLRFDLRPNEQVDLFPASFSRYQVRGILGTGGYGRVYLADDPLLQRTVAIKALQSKDFISENARIDFLKTARQTAAFEHPSIVPIYDVIENEMDRSLIVMKYIDGQTLSEWMRESRPSREQWMRLMIQIARAVDFAHHGCLIHRNLKPSNIMVDQQGRGHVMDFGLSVHVQQLASDADWLGESFPYMSPEAMALPPNTESIDHRTDVWSLGVILFELDHGVRLFTQRHRANLHAAINSQELTLPHRVDSTGLNEIILRCLARSTSDRFESAGELADSLSRWVRRNCATGLARWQFGWRRNVMLAWVAVALLGCFGATQWWANQIRIQDTIRALAYGPTDQIPTHLAQLQLQKTTAETVQTHFPNSNNRSVNLRVELAVFALSERSKQAMVRLVKQVELAEPNEIASIVDTVQIFEHTRESNQELIRLTLDRLHETSLTSHSRLSLASFFAGVAQDHPAWKHLGSELAQSLTGLSAEKQKEWIPLLGPVGSELSSSLHAIMTSPKSSAEVRKSAAIGLARILANQPGSLADFILDTDASELPSLIDGLMTHREQAIERLRHQLDRLQVEDISEASSALDVVKRCDIQRSQIAIALWLLGETEPTCDALEDRSDPTLPSLMVHGLAKQNIAPKCIVELIERQSTRADARSVATRFGLLQVLSQWSRDSNRIEIPHALLNQLWLKDEDCGVHGMVRLLAARNGIELMEQGVGEYGRRTVERIGTTLQDFAVIEPCVADMGTKSISKAPPGTNPWPSHRRRFAYRFAIATNEVTIQQFRDVDNDFLAEDRMLVDSARDAAMMRMTLDKAYQFCNRISETAGLVPCYELQDIGESIECWVPKANHLTLFGYRLPTDGEWELACRAGSTTDRYFGNSHETVTEYGWTLENVDKMHRSNNEALQSQRVAAFLPNRWGLFDLYGNAKELCATSNSPDGTLEQYDDNAVSQAAAQRLKPMLRGISLEFTGLVYGKSYCRTNGIVASADRTIGFRIARTLPDR